MLKNKEGQNPDHMFIQYKLEELFCFDADVLV